MAKNDDAHESGMTCRVHHRRDIDDHDHRDSRRDRELKFWTIAQVADRLQVAARTVQRWIENDELVVHRIHGVIRISEGDLRHFLATYREG